MSLALYRKYRPGSFAQVKGQEHVTGPLRQALTNQRIHHAYLFSGPRGCGKTSSARILARSLNCAQGPTPDPCGVCDSCVALAPNGAGSLDVVEIDAASHGGVDDARDLREKAIYAPVRDRYKIYIIDEAHMVGAAAFNALLKLVEEPPEFVKFVFATTEPEKVLQTIRSRTHHYPFRLMPRKDLTVLLQEVVAAEGIAVDEQVLPLVVRAAAGSARDALSILDQVLASAGADGVTREAAAGLLGVTPDVLLDDVLDAFSVGDAASVFATVDAVMEGGHDPRRFAADVLERLRDLVILDAVPDAGVKGVLDCPAEQLERMGRQGAAFGTAGLSRAADLFHVGLTEMRGTTAPRLLLELVCARVLLPTASTAPSAVLARLEVVERRFEIGGPGPVPATPPRVAPGVGAPAPSAPAAGALTAVEPPSSGPSTAGPPPPEVPAASVGAAPPVGAVTESVHAEREVVGAGSPSTEPDVRPAQEAGTAPAQPGFLVAATSDPSAASATRAPPRPPAAASIEAAPPARVSVDRPAASTSAWPTAAVPGGGPPQQAEPVAPDPASEPTPGGLDAASVRRVWDQVLQHVKERKRVTHARLTDTQVAALDGRRLTLVFTTATLARQFQEGVNVDVLREAVQAVLGADLQITCTSGSTAPAVHAPVAVGAPVPGTPAQHEGFAPGDEAADDDAAAPPAQRGEDAALRLVERELGGRVVGTTGD